MSVKVLEKIGRAGNARQRKLTQENWDRKYGKGWYVGYCYKEKTYTYDEALVEFYHKSYFEFMKKNPNIVEELCSQAKELYNPHAEKTGGVDLQVPAVLEALSKLNKTLKGTERIAIGVFGTKNGLTYPAISNKLSPFKVPLWCNSYLSVETFWQNYKFLLKNE